VAPAVKTDDTSGPATAVLLPNLAGGKQKELSARQYTHQHNRSLF